MTEEWVKTTVSALSEWAAERGEQFDQRGAEILLGLAAGLGVADPAGLSPEQLRRLLLEEFPDQVVAGPGEVPSVLATLGSLVEFLSGTGAITQQQAALLRGELAGIEPEFTRALRTAGGSEEEAAVEMIFEMMRDDGVDPVDTTAMREWVIEFEALSDEEKAIRMEPYLDRLEVEDGELSLPPVRLLPEEELAATAGESRLLTDAVALAEWAGRRGLTPDGELTGQDAAEAVAVLRLDTPRAGGGAPRVLGDVPELARLWHAAVAAGLIEVGEGAARPGPCLAGVQAGGRQAVLDTWVSLLDDAVTLGLGDQEGDREHDHDHDHDHDHLHHEELNPYGGVRDALPGVLLHLYEQERPTPRAELLRALAEHLLGAYELSGKAAREWRAAGEHAFDLELADLARWGVVAGGPGGYTLTPLGVWGVRELLMADGYTAPLVGDLASSSAEDLVVGLAMHREDTADEEIDLWLAGREPRSAATELIRVMAAGTPGTRNLAAAVLQRLDPAAEPVVRTALDDRLTRPYATLWLHQHGDQTVMLAPSELTWIFIDTVAGLLETTEPAVAITTALADAPAELDLREMAEDMWRVEHPDVAEVLDALGDHHPDKPVAKAARRAAFKARSSRGRS